MKHHMGIMIVGALVIILMLLFPPFHVMYAPGIEIDKGYAFILNPPKFWDQHEGTVDIGRLMVQVGGAVLLFSAAYLVMRSYRKR